MMTLHESEQHYQQILQANPRQGPVWCLLGETRLRLQRLLEKTSPPAGNRLRALRMLELLERIGTPAAQDVLRALPDKESDVWLAREAKAIAARLRGRAGDKP